jgi:2,3-bisphosphoglycerate-independent phosphoglycerate mutase
MHFAERRVLLIFLDGVGLGVNDPVRNPFFSAPLLFLRELLDGEIPSLRRPRISARHAECIPVNATLRVPGLPQSGTGQATLYTGVNTARVIGKHFGPYLYSTIKPIVAERNIFRQLLDFSFTPADLALANAFPQRFFDYLNGHARRMPAGVFAARAAGIQLRDITHLKKGAAVSTDITARRWRNIGHPDAPVITPFEAGRCLAGIAAEHRFTLFEFFMTDKAGHDRSLAEAVALLEELDDFLRGVFEEARQELLVLVTSDHGNMEDLSTKSHTRNPVPLIAFGPGKETIREKIRSLSHISPAILTFLRG